MTSRARSAVLFVALWGAGFSPAPVAHARAVSAEAVFGRHRGQVLQVRVVDRAAGSKAGIGSGFVVGAEDLVVTNYHVVSGLVLRPGQYRAEYRTESGVSGELRLAALDVVHDLALLRADHAIAAPLELTASPPPHGERLFSLGNPYDLGLTIVEGTYNGLLEKSLYDKMHFTGSVNPGMSGGPAVNGDGMVVGVNVATAGDQVSFLVPAEFVAALVESRSLETAATPVFLDQVRSQLRANQERYLAELLSGPLASMDIGDYRVPGALARYVSCWGDSPERDPDQYRFVYQACSSADDLFVSDELSVGSIRFRHERFQTDRGDPLRFYRFLEKHFQEPHLGFDGTSTDVSRFECETEVTKSGGVTAKVVFCVRGYRELAGLYDAFLTATTLDRDEAALHTSLALTGITFDNAAAFARAYLEAIRWKP